MASSDPDQSPGETSGAGATSPEEELARLHSELIAAQEQVLRVAAETENIRKRAARDIEQAHRFALEKFAQELLPVRDSLELAVANAGRADPASLVAGQEATLKLLARAFERFSIVGVEPNGEPFDPQRHEAIAMRESSSAEPQSVLEVVQRGYELNGRLLRPARVVVSKPPESA
jgi:molecular chaperone GrpE